MTHQAPEALEEKSTAAASSEEQQDSVKQAIKKMEELKEGKVLATRYTVDGEALVVRKNGKDVTMLPNFPELKPLPEKWTQADHHAIGIIYGCSHQIRTELKKRQVPLTRNEAIKEGVSKKQLHRLEKKGFIQERLIKLTDAKGTPLRSVAVVYLTPQGRSYVLKHIDPDYRKEITANYYEEPKDNGQESSEAPVNGSEGDHAAAGAPIAEDAAGDSAGLQ